jgi:cytochrome c heme-lyase
MGNQQARTTATNQQEEQNSIPSQSRCPVKHNKLPSSPPPSSTSKCPVKGVSSENGTKNKSTKYDVYSQPIDPTNQMPSNPNQFPHKSQKVPLNTSRVRSTIPKGGGTDDETWTYPSEQMFFNSLKRKGKGSDAEEGDMANIIAIHNNMNERTWNKLLEYEKTYHCDECSTPKLLKFLGRPHDLSMKARLKSTFFGYNKPFDRHDWTIDRCGTNVRYIIDYYHDEDEEGDIKPHLRSRTDVKSITVDVRPAPFDSFANFFDVVRMPFSQVMGSVADVYEDDSSEEMGKKGEEDDDDGIVHPKIHPDFVFSAMQEFRSKCKDTAEELKKCTNELDCAKKYMALDVCFGNIVCPAEAANFVKDPSEETYEPLQECIARFKKESTSG